MRPSLALSAAGFLLLAGCAGDPRAPLPGNGASDGTHALAGGAAPSLAHWNYTTPDLGGAPFTKAYSGSLTPAEVSGLQGGLPLGLSPPEFATCCYMDWVEAPGLLAADQLAAVRVTVSWTNTETDRAGLDAAVCLPWACTAFNFGPDESQASGPHSDTLTLITSGRQDWLDAGLPYLLGVRYTNAAVATGLAYDISIEAAPIGNGLAPLDAHRVHVPAGANVTAELVGAFEDEVSAGLMVYGPDDRPLQWVELRGAPGERVRVPLPAGTPVVVPFAA
ncbi:MAG TPA: hypothetical protein VHI93_08530, partial [Candidatus Thermoplasmatota archaeon]|nr:hypothetical protein [Candidatus Thermoplasmatota archaeon]